MKTNQPNIIEKHPESKAIVRFQDCDPFNHLNNSKYLDYFLNAREDHLMNYYAFDIYKTVKETGLGWVVAENNISYMSPARLMETVVIQTSLISHSKNTLIVESLMLDNDKKMFKALMWTKYFHLNLTTSKSALHSDELMEFFQSILLPLEENVSFEDRIFFFRSKKVKA